MASRRVVQTYFVPKIPVQDHGPSALALGQHQPRPDWIFQAHIHRFLVDNLGAGSGIADLRRVRQRRLAERVPSGDVQGDPWLFDWFV